MDVVDPATRSRIMATIGPKDTSPELVLRKGLHSLGFRFRLHQKDLPGRPDMVLRRFGAIVEARGCFWHGHGCYLFKQPETNAQFWSDKINDNRNRDIRNIESLALAGWRVAIVWECAIRGRNHRDRLPQLMSALADWIRSCDSYIEISGGDAADGELRYRMDWDDALAAERPMDAYTPTAR